MALLSREAFQRAEEIASSMTYFDLMSHTGYMEEFIRAKFLPHTDLSLFPSVHGKASEPGIGETGLIGPTS